MDNSVALEIDGDEVIVRGSEITSDRAARLFFLGSLGATCNENCWRCPRRRQSMEKLVVRINTFLERKGWQVSRERIADAAVQRALERKRSFQRTREAAEAFFGGESTISLAKLERAMASQGWRGERKLRPHQQQGALHALTAGSAANFSVPGAGKTATTIAVAAAHLDAKTIDLVLVVGPLSCFAPWEHEVMAVLPDRLRTLRVRGSSANRRRLYSQIRGTQVVLVSYATAAADKVALIELCRTYRVMMVVDESHRAKRFKGGVWAPALIEIAKEARVRMILSGTPMPQSGKDLYSQFSILWPEGELTGPREDFALRVDREFSGLMRDLRPFMTRTPKQALGLKPYSIVRHDVPLVGTQAEIYELIEGYFRKQIQNAEAWTDKIELLKRARPIRLLQAAANPDVLNRGDSYYRLPSMEVGNASLMERLAAYRALETPAKTAFALKLLREFAIAGRKVVCWSNFIANLDQFSQAVRALGIACFQVDGRVAAGMESDSNHAEGEEEPETRERVIESFLDHGGAAVLVANPASCSESISLHRACRVAVYLDRTYDCALFLQSIDRIHRLGLPPDAEVEVHVLNATVGGRSTIDQLVDASLLQKEGAMLQLLQGAEVVPLGSSEDPLEGAEGERRDLESLLRFLLGEGG